MIVDAFVFREARREDVAAIVDLLAADPLGALREAGTTSPLPSSYFDAFDAIAADANQSLLVAVSDERVVGVLQLTFIPSLTYRGSWRAQVEGVRVAASMRSRGLGRAMIEHAIAMARATGCRMVQLTTDRQRRRALDFYTRMGFTPTHHGLKLHLESPARPSGADAPEPSD